MCEPHFRAAQNSIVFLKLLSQFTLVDFFLIVLLLVYFDFHFCVFWGAVLGLWFFVFKKTKKYGQEEQKEERTRSQRQGCSV